MTITDRLVRQLDFIAEIDRLKSVERRISIIGGTRLENSAEHSWHLAMMASLLIEYAGEGVDLLRAKQMVLVHDIVEIDAGDTFAFDDRAREDQAARERVAAERLFGVLPPDQAVEFRALWDEFEAFATPTARFAVALDRFQARLLNRGNGGGTWHMHGVARDRVLSRMEPIREVVPQLWPFVLRTLDEVGLAGDAR
ncbi:MAG: HD domain-containing protein [Gemmatimonadetes bacterium]|nr:HD domain-containing protein [Gemmatimonadota bacterium]